VCYCPASPLLTGQLRVENGKLKIADAAKIHKKIIPVKIKFAIKKKVDSSTQCNWIIQGGGKYLPWRVKVK
jgi:hypothetical protein